MIIYIVIFIVLFLIAIHYYDRRVPLTMLLIGCFLTLFAGLRGPDVDRDYSTYKEYFETAKQTPTFEYFSFIEPTFTLFAKTYPSLPWLIFTYALISVIFTLKAIHQLTPFAFFTVAIWFCHFFLVHDMNQIRAGAAIGILLLSIPPLIEKKLFKFILLILIAAQFHFSALIFLPLYFLNSTKINKIYYFLIPASYVLYILGIGLIELLSQINVSFLQGKIEAYKLLLDQGMYSKLNVFNPLALIRIALIYLFLYNWETLAAKNPYFIIMLKVYIFSVVVMVLLAGLPAFALRVSDMFSIMEILLIPFLFYLFRSKYTALLIVLGLCGLFLFLDLFYNKFLDPYSLI